MQSGECPQNEKAHSACADCRSRKIKCDRHLPLCSSCTKHGRQCVYQATRKKTVRHSSYREITERLQRMESLVQNLAGSSSNGKPLPLEPDHDDGFQSFESITPQQKARSPPTPPPGVKKLGNPSGIVLDTPMDDSSQPSDTSLNSASTRFSHDKIKIIHTGTRSIFSPQGISWINKLVGDDSFGRLISKVSVPLQSIHLDFHTHDMPDQAIIFQFLQQYLHELNSFLYLFNGGELIQMTIEQATGTLPPDPGWHMAINAVMAHCALVNLNDVQESSKYIQNATHMIPKLLTSPPSPLNISAQLCVVMYFMFISENQTAVNLLASVVQQLILLGYHRPDMGVACSEKDLHHKRIFWRAFIFDHDLSLRMNKPPLIGPDFEIELPEQFPRDNHTILQLHGGRRVNFLREQVILATLQSKTYEHLYSARASKASTEELAARVGELDNELLEWKNGIPEVSKRHGGMTDLEYDALIALTELHYTYYQLIIAVHSFILRGLFRREQPEDKERILASVALCVGAARASISLLNSHDRNHGFTVRRYLLHHVAWSVDILCIHILQNKNTARAVEDLRLLEQVIRFYKKYDSNHKNTLAFQIIEILHQIASRALRPPTLTGRETQQTKHITDDNIQYFQMQGYSSMRGVPPSDHNNDNENSLGQLSNQVTQNDERQYPLDPGFPGELDLQDSQKDILCSQVLPKLQDQQASGMLDSTYMMNGIVDLNFLDMDWHIPVNLEPEYWQYPWSTAMPPQGPFEWTDM